MAKGSSQKFIQRNRAPRVQIEYDVELYGATKKIELPFVMGVMADLSGNPAEEQPGLGEKWSRYANCWRQENNLRISLLTWMARMGRQA